MGILLKQKPGTRATTHTTQLDSLASGVLAAPVAYDNTQGAAGDGYVRCSVELVVSFGSAPAAGSAFAVWFLRAQDDSTYEDGGVGVTPARIPDLKIPVRAVTGAQRITVEANLPAGKLKILPKNDDTGQQTASSGNTLSIRPETEGAYDE